jgi:hypothetical protein
MTKETDMRKDDLEDLEDLFAEAREQSLPDSEALMAKIMADAFTHLPRTPALPLRREVVHKSGFWSRITLALGGKGVLAGLCTAMVAGVMLGFTQPSSLATLTDSIFVQTPLDDVELLPGIDAILAEG